MKKITKATQRRMAELLHKAQVSGMKVSACVLNRSLGDKVVCLKSRRDEIIAAPDLLFTGI